MWAIIAPILGKAALNIALALLTKLDIINTAESDGIKVGTHVLQAVKNMKTVDTYPGQKDKFSAV